MRLLVTGFGPFPGAPRNPTAALAGAIARSGRWRRLGIAAQALVLPTVYAQAQPLIAARASGPDAVLMLGLAGRRRWLSVEIRAQNRLSLRHKDAAGALPDARQIRRDGPAQMRARAPLGPLAAAGRRQGLPTRLSRDAGAYLCNAGLWWMLEAASPAPVVFVHLPRRLRRRGGAGVTAAALRHALEEMALLLLRARRADAQFRGSSEA